MSTHRLFNILIAAALLAVAVMTAWQSLETARVVQAASAEHSRSADIGYCISAAQKASMTSVYVEKVGGWYPRIGSTFTGVEGGLLDLLSGNPGCLK